MNDSRVLVVGGGFLGSALAKSLSQRSRQVTILSPHGEPSARSDAPAIVRGRQEDKTLMSELLEQHDIVIHAAWGTTPSSSARRPTIEAAAGLAPWLAFLEALEQFPAVRILFLSSGGTVYGNPERLPVTENTPLHPVSCHGAGKVAAEIFLAAQRRLRSAPAVVLRPSNVYGPGQTLRGGFGVIRHLLQCAADSRPFALLGDGSNVRDYLYIEDFVGGVLALIERPGDTDVYNIGSGSGVSLSTLITLVEEVTECPIRVQRRDPRAGDVGEIVLDIGKIYRETGWKPSTSLTDGIENTWRWIRTTT